MPNKNSFLISMLLLLFVGGQGANSVGQEPKHTLHERAKKVHGKLIWRYRPSRKVIYADVDALAKKSDLIVVGRTLGHRPTLRADGKFLTNDFLVRVQESIKGSLPIGKSIIISIPGGAYRFSDGSYASMVPTGYTDAEDGVSYIFFLKNKNSKFKGYRLTSVSQGLFALKNGIVEPADMIQRDPVVTKYRGISSAALLQEIHRVVPLEKRKK